MAVRNHDHRQHGQTIGEDIAMDYLLLAIIAAAGAVVGFILHLPVVTIIDQSAKCPACREHIKPGAVRCKHCQAQWALPVKSDKTKGI
jgi:hypothetical protein